jgi:AcrR family transcriptional regulator
MATSSNRTGDLREACVKQALEIIAKGGIDSLSLRDVARRLGVSHQAPYKHFPSRDHILA